VEVALRQAGVRIPCGWFFFEGDVELPFFTWSFSREQSQFILFVQQCLNGYLCCKKMSFCYHTHSLFCDGKSSMEDMCRSALEKGMTIIGFSSHAPVPVQSEWAMKFEDVLAYRSEIERCQAIFAGQLLVYAGLEADYFPPYTLSFSEWKRILNLDYIIGAVHLVKGKNDQFWFLDGPVENYETGLQNAFSGDIQEAVSTYFNQIRQMVQTQQPDVVAHLDKVVMNNKGRFFSESEMWYQKEVAKTLDVIQLRGTIVEVNTRGIYRKKWNDFFPSKDIIKACIKRNIPLTISPDAHHRDEADAGFQDALGCIRELGGTDVLVLDEGKWKQCALDSVLVEND
jgi:histidinol-phosphatase (PHP family)